jgi:pyruvate dehydrogenase E2 component (dihydrolipoyllysine-residue acetyltransferase)
MPTDVIMPKLGLTMESGTVQRWLARAGERLEAGQTLLEVETDKVVVEVEAPAPGILGPVLVSEGETVPLGTVLARIYPLGEKPAERAVVESPEPVRPKPVQAAGLAPGITPLARRIADGQGAGQRERTFSSPRARRRAKEANLDWRAIPGSGPRGRVIERDVLAAVAKGQPSTLDHGQSTMDDGRSPVVYRPSSTTTAPHFYLSAEAPADALLELRERLLPVIERRAGVQLTVTDLLVKIVATALAEHPRANAFWDPAGGGRIGLHRRGHLGLAVATEAGLMAPVLRDADRMGLTEIAAARTQLVERARHGRLSPGELEDSTFMLADLSMYRVDVFQAILTPPQSAVLAVGRIAERPVVVNRQLCVRPTVVLTLSCDHRVLDGLLGARILDRVVELIEEPYDLIA